MSAVKLRQPCELFGQPTGIPKEMHSRETFRPQPCLDEHCKDAVVLLSPKQIMALYNKSQQSGFPFDLLEQVFKRGVSLWNPDTRITKEQYAFNRVNSFIAGGRAAQDDVDLVEDTPSDREVGTDSLVQTYKRDTPGQNVDVVRVIKRTLRRTNNA